MRSRLSFFVIDARARRIKHSPESRRRVPRFMTVSKPRRRAFAGRARAPAIAREYAFTIAWLDGTRRGVEPVPDRLSPVRVGGATRVTRGTALAACDDVSAGDPRGGVRAAHGLMAAHGRFAGRGPCADGVPESAPSARGLCPGWNTRSPRVTISSRNTRGPICALRARKATRTHGASRSTARARADASATELAVVDSLCRATGAAPSP